MIINIVYSASTMILIDLLYQVSNRNERVVSLLTSVAGNELQTHKLYTEFLASTYASAVPEVVDLFKRALDEDHGHYYAVAGCIERLNAVAVENSSPISLPKHRRLSRNMHENMHHRICR